MRLRHPYPRRSVVVTSVRLRQVVVVARDLGAVASELQRRLDLPDPFVDPGVGEFGLENRVFAVGHDFLEVLTPTREGTAGGRYLDRRGGDAGYMAIFQFPDRGALDEARRRVVDLGVRIVWQADLDDISGTHLHPADVPGAIVSLDAADPPESWHWAGPSWRGGAPADRAGGGVGSLTVAAVDPPVMARRWAEVLGGDVHEASTVVVAGGAQRLHFVEQPTGRREDEGIIGLGLRRGDGAPAFDVAGVHVTVEPLAG